MSKTLVKEGQVQAQEPALRPETFKYTTQRGNEIIAGKPRGVLKLKLRNILKLEELEKDMELTQMASAFLSIRTVDGEQPKCSNRLQFEALQNLFGDDADLDGFMNAYQKFVNPEQSEFIEECLREATEAGLVEPDEIKAFMTKKLLERAEMNQEKVRL